MNCTTMTILKAILPAILTIVGNLLFYICIKKKVDNSIEKHKIAFSGIFKERVDIYKEILRQIFDIKQSMHQYQYAGTSDKGEKIMLNINQFINFYLINQPFLSDKMISELKKVREEFQSVFDSFYIHHSTSKEQGIDPETRTELLKKFFEAGNKLKGDHPFKTLEETIIKEMRTDLRVDNF
jgi:hypothetical protein